MRSRWQHGSGSGELDVFGATSYFAAGLPDRCPGDPAPGRLIQANKATHRVNVADEQLGLHDDAELQAQLVVAKPTSSGKSKLAALLSFMVSPSPRASFRKMDQSPPATNKPQLGGGDGLAITKASSSSSRELEGCGGVIHELAIDLGVATGDRRLQGVRVVRGGGGDQQRWVVRCSAWDEEHHESSSDPSCKDEVVEEGDDGDRGDWESDSSSDLFDLDLEYIY